MVELFEESVTHTSKDTKQHLNMFSSLMSHDLPPGKIIKDLVYLDTKPPILWG